MLGSKAIWGHCSDLLVMGGQRPAEQCCWLSSLHEGAVWWTLLLSWLSGQASWFGGTGDYAQQLDGAVNLLSWPGGALEWAPIGWDKSNSIANWAFWPVGVTCSVLQGSLLSFPNKQECIPPISGWCQAYLTTPSLYLSDPWWLSLVGFISDPQEARLEWAS